MNVPPWNGQRQKVPGVQVKQALRVLNLTLNSRPPPRPLPKTNSENNPRPINMHHRRMKNSRKLKDANEHLFKIGVPPWNVQRQSHWGNYCSFHISLSKAFWR